MSGDGFLSRWARRKALVRQGVEVEADAPHPGPLPRGAREQAPRGAGLDLPVGQALDPLADQRSPLPAERSAATASPCNVEPEALAPSPLWGDGRGEGHGPLPPPATSPKTLADVAAVTPDADFTPFLSPQVQEHVKRAALKKLFADPHFNLMDGLDTYIDDYSKPDPIPESMLRRMAQSEALGLFDDAEESARSQEQNAWVPGADPSGDAVSLDAAQPDLEVETPGADAQAAPASPDPEASPDGVAMADLPQSLTASPAVPPHEDPDLRLQQDHAAGRSGPREGAAG